jgi:hypothetical protein
MSNYVCNHRILPDCDAAIPGVHNPLGDVMSKSTPRCAIIVNVAVASVERGT